MQRSIPCWALLLAALLLLGAAAQPRCDPRSPDCAGVADDAQQHVATAAAEEQQQGEPSYIRKPAYEDPEFGPWVWQQHGGLEGAKVFGELLFNHLEPGSGPNYFAAEEGYVPHGYGNSDVPMCEISSTDKEFAYEGHSNLFTVDIDGTGYIVLANLVKVAGKNNPMTINIRSPAFEGYSLTTVNSTFLQPVGAVLVDDTVMLHIPEIANLTAGQKQLALFKLSVCDDQADMKCCLDGQYRKPSVCRQSAGPCDIVEMCSGKSGLCPPDEFKPAYLECRPAQSFCDLPDFCTGYSAGCDDNTKPEGFHCPWSKDCEGCTISEQSPLHYQRTAPKPPVYVGTSNIDSASAATSWPVCVGKCKAGKCLMDPPAATCCKEDEEALPYIDEEEEGNADDYYPMKVHTADKGEESDTFMQTAEAVSPTAVMSQGKYYRRRNSHSGYVKESPEEAKRSSRHTQRQSAKHSKRKPHKRSSSEHDKEHKYDQHDEDKYGAEEHKEVINKYVKHNQGNSRHQRYGENKKDYKPYQDDTRDDNPDVDNTYGKSDSNKVSEDYPYTPYSPPAKDDEDDQEYKVPKSRWSTTNRKKRSDSYRTEDDDDDDDDDDDEDDYKKREPKRSDRRHRRTQKDSKESKPSKDRHKTAKHNDDDKYAKDEVEHHKDTTADSDSKDSTSKETLLKHPDKPRRNYADEDSSSYGGGESKPKDKETDSSAGKDQEPAVVWKEPKYEKHQDDSGYEGRDSRDSKDLEDDKEPHSYELPQVEEVEMPLSCWSG